MHYRNGREAKNGDKIVQLGSTYDADGKESGGVVVSFGVLHSATPGNDYCNGGIAIPYQNQSACMCDCLHVDDLAAILAEKGLDKRPETPPAPVAAPAADTAAADAPPAASDATAQSADTAQ